MKAKRLSNLIAAALLLTASVGAGSTLLVRPAVAQQQLVAQADPSAMVVLCFRMSPRTTDQDKQFVVSYLMQQGLTNVGFRPNGYECVGTGTCADAMRIMKSQLYVAQLTLSNQMILAYRFDPLPQNPLPLNNKARYAAVTEATSFTSGGAGGFSTGTGGSGSGTGAGSNYTGNQQGNYQFGSGQSELGNGLVGGSMNGGSMNGGSQFGGSQFGGSQFGGSQFGGSQSGGSQYTGSQYGGSQYGGSQYSNSPYGNTQQTGYQSTDGMGGGVGSKPIWNKTNGTLSPTGLGIPELYGNNTTANPANGIGSQGTGNYGGAGNYGNAGGYGNTGGGNFASGGAGGSQPIWNKTNGTLSPTGQGIPELYGGNTTANPATNGLGNLDTGNMGGGQIGNANSSNGFPGSAGGLTQPAYNPNTPAYNPNAQYTNAAQSNQGTNSPAFNLNTPAYNPNLAGPSQ
ncbi:MAG TPA: hypothetical protein V6C89_06490 [Drouetiella sp.]|jgi:hypothetical protein